MKFQCQSLLNQGLSLSICRSPADARQAQVHLHGMTNMQGRLSVSL